MRRPALALLLGCLLLVAGASALDGYDYYQTIEYAACDQETYQQDIVVHRTTGTAYNETAGGLETWHIYVGDHCREDYGDVRFTNSTGAELAYYLWPDYSSSSARFAVRLEGADTAGTLTVWYGNPTATTTSDGDAVYLFFDQFEGTALNTSKWDITATSLTVSGGICTIPDSGWKGIATKATFGNGVMAVCHHKVYSSTSTTRVATMVGFSSLSSYDSGRNIYYSGGGSYEWPGGASKPFATGGTRGVFASTMIIRKAAAYVMYNTAGDTRSASVLSGNYPFVINKAGLAEYYDYILVRAYSAAPPAALTFSGEPTFIATPTAGLAPLSVQFTDTSTGGPTSWLWTFGDGNTSTAQNPAHTYTTAGTYSVSLTATNEYGSDYELKTDYITVYGPITAQFTTSITGGTAPLTVQFTDTSAGGPTSWLWTFGDGNTSTDQNPQHTYTVAGTHTVTLTASHPYDSDTETKTAYITVAVLQPFPGLSLTPTDLTGDGLYEDINGNGRSDYNDLTIFFLNLAWARDNEPTECFDFNQNGRLDYADVIALFQVIKNA